MASSLTKLKLLTARSMASFRRPVAAASTRLFSTKLGIQRDGSGECNFKLNNDGTYTTDVPDVFNSYFMYNTLNSGNLDSSNAICPRLSATCNLVRLLYLMDDRVLYPSCALPVWDVMEDESALYLVRNLSRLSHKDAKEFVTHSPTGLMTIYGTSLRVFRETPIPPAIELTVARCAPGFHPGAFYPGYMLKIHLPDSVYEAEGIEMDVQDQFLRVSIPKTHEGKLIENIDLQLKLFSTIDDPIFYWSPSMKTKKSNPIPVPLENLI